MSTVLYRKNRLGVGSWRIWNEDNTIYIAHAQTAGGSEIVHTEFVATGLAGRSLEDQVRSRIASRINHQRDKGYVDSYEQAFNNTLSNTLGMPPPMLAIKHGDATRLAWNNVICQTKFDGFRCMVTRREDGSVLCYSRQGKELTALHHLVDAFDRTLPEGIVLDGEIYSHGQSLQSIASLAKRKQPGTESLVYNVYDCVSNSRFLDRWQEAADIVKAADSPNIVIVQNHPVFGWEQVWDLFAQFRSQGYEGAMLRCDGYGYESGARSRSLVKVKAREDGEFRIIGVEEGSDGCGILVCRLDNGKTFKTLAPGTHDEKRWAFMNSPEVIGKKVTVEYANFTADGIPFHAVATRYLEVL